MRPSSGAAAASWNAKEKGNDDERRDERRTEERANALNTALVAALGRLPRLRCVGSLRQLLEHPPESGDEKGALTGTSVSGGVTSPLSAATARAARCRLRLKHTVRIRMSWDDTTSLHVYCCARGSTQ